MTSPEGPSELKQALGGLRPYFAKAGWFSLVAGLLALMPSWYMLEVYDRVVNSRNPITLLMLTLAVLGAYAVMEMLEWARSELMRESGLALDRALGQRVFNAVFDAKLRSLPLGTTQPMADLRTLREFLHSPALLAAMEAPVATVFLALIFAINPLLGWSALVAAAVQVAVGWLNERGTQPVMQQANRVAMEAQLSVDGTLRNAQVLEAMGMLHDVRQRWQLRQDKFLGLQALASKRAGLYQTLSKVLQNLVSSMLLGLSCWLLLRGQLNGGGAMLIVSGILGGRALAPLVQIVTQWRAVLNVREAWKRLDQLLAAVPAKPSGMALPAPRGMLQVEQLTALAPGSSVPILRGLNFALSPGEVLAVVGPSAAGKTTLARLLVGLWPAASGKVRQDGVDIHAWDKAELGPHIGYLAQGVELLEGTIAENIARFAAVDMAQVEAAARAVGLHEDILRLPQGYASPVGRDAAVLSGGQAQRIGLARAVYGQPVFVVLDEPNSNLDAAGEAALAQLIVNMKVRGTSFVVITHRSALVDLADKVLVLHEGQVAAFGPREQVTAALKKASAEAQAQTTKPAAPHGGMGVAP